MCPVLPHRIPGSLLVALLLGLLLALPAAHARAGLSRVVVTNTDDPVVQTGCTSILDYCSLREALAASAAGDTIDFHPQVQGTITLDSTQGTLTLNHLVTIMGPGAGTLAVSGNGSIGVFSVNSGVTATISGLTIMNGHTSARGAGINSSGTLTLIDSVVTGNTVASTGNASGGGIYAGGPLTLTRTTVSNNAVTSTGTVQALGGGIEQPGGTLTVTGSTISGNIVQVANAGGDIICRGGGIDNQGTLNLTGSTVSGNQILGCATQGVGIGIATSGTANVTNSTIAGNSAPGGNTNASAIFSGGTLSLVGSTITGNRAAYGALSLGGTATLIDDLIARNADATGNMDVSGAVTATSRNNLIGNGASLSGISNGSQGNQIGTTAAPINPKLDPAGLQANGGVGPATVGLLANSPAIEAGGSCPSGVTADERGQSRIGNCDIGAYEYQPVIPTVADATVSVGGGLFTFSGVGFQTGSQLTIGPTTFTATAADVSTDGTQLTLRIPAHAVGTVGIMVANPGDRHVATGTLTYQSPTTLPAPVSVSGRTGSPSVLPGPLPSGPSSPAGRPSPLPAGR
jgi:hypothetical protein